MQAQLAHQVPLALMADHDRRESQTLLEDLTAAMEGMVHPRTMVKFKPLIRCVSSLLYFCVPLLSASQSTPGQDFCALDMVEETLSTAGSVIPTSSSGTGGVGASQRSFTRLSRGRRWAAALLMALLPQVPDLWERGRGDLLALLSAVTSNDSDIAIGEAASAAEAAQMAQAGERRVQPLPQPVPLPSQPSSVGGALLPAGADSAMADGVGEEEGAFRRFLRRAAGALKATYGELCLQLGGEIVSGEVMGSARLLGVRRAAELLLDVHGLLFVIFGLYYDPALRLAGVKMMQRKGARAGASAGLRAVSLRVLAWLLGLRLALLCGNVGRLFCKHWRVGAASAMRLRPVSSLATPASHKPRQPGQPGGKGGGGEEEEERGGFRVAGMDDRACPLCMDPIRHPAATPCGHVYCWDCIQGLCQRTGAASFSGSLAGQGQASHALAARSKCPVCRAAFLPQSVRAIFCA
jgi:hypothetical protein